LLLPWEIQPYRPVQPTNPIDPLSQPYLSSTRRRAFSEYGGFERRSTVPMEEGAIAALTRRHRLIEATTLNAPVYRALDQTVGTGSPRPVLEVVPTIGPLVTPIASPVPAVHPDQFLREGMDKAGTRAKEDARAWFQRGHYRQAARAFETAALMNPSDGEALIGQVFCYFSVGAARTALVLLREIAREDADPFRYALNPTTFYGSPDELRRVRVEIQFLAEAAKGSDDLAALRALLLWYFGDRHEAAVVAAAIHRDFPASPFANWVSRMREGSPDRAGSDGAPE
jgi:tetratricopeptide (TPR) repeat protein